MGFDLTALEVTPDGEKMVVRDPTTNVPLTFKDGEVEKSVTITLVGEDSSRYKARQHELANRRSKARMQARGMYVISAEESEADALETVVVCTVAWEGIDLGGAPLPFSAENVRKIYGKFPWLYEQAQLFILDRANFMKASSKS